MKSLLLIGLLATSLLAGVSGGNQFHREAQKTVGCGAKRFKIVAMRILWCMPGFPFDPTGGGNRSLRTMCEMLASEGHTVRCVGTFKTSTTLFNRTLDYVRENYGTHGYYQGRHAAGFLFRHVHYVIAFRETDLTRMFDWELDRTEPDIVLTYGGNPQDFDRMERAKRAGAKIVFGLRNGLYKDKNHFRLCDGIVTPSQWMTDWYKRTLGLDSTPLPLPINAEDCVSTEREPYFITFVNPSHEKGEQIARAITVALPGQSFQIVESRGKAKDWPANCKIVGPLANPREIYRNAGIMLVPSLWEEPGGRVVCEAMLNGIPPIVSDRGALPEVLNAGGFVIPTARKLFDHSPVTDAEIQPWVDAIRVLHPKGIVPLNHRPYQMAAENAYAAGWVYDSVPLTRQYCDFFESVLKGVPGWTPPRRREAARVIEGSNPS